MGKTHHLKMLAGLGGTTVLMRGSGVQVQQPVQTAQVSVPMVTMASSVAYSGLKQLAEQQQDQSAVREQHRQLKAQLEQQQQDAGTAFVVATTCKQAGFTSMDRSAADTLGLLFNGYVEQIAEASRDLATLAGRSQSTLNDLEIVLGNIGIKTSELQEHMEMTRGASKAAITNRIPTSAQQRQSKDYDFSTQLLGADDIVLAPSYVPDHLPAFPPRHSFIFTPMDPTVEKSDAQLQKQKCDQRRQIELALFNLMSANQISSVV